MKKSFVKMVETRSNCEEGIAVRRNSRRSSVISQGSGRSRDAPASAQARTTGRNFTTSQNLLVQSSFPSINPQHQGRASHRAPIHHFPRSLHSFSSTCRAAFLGSSCAPALPPSLPDEPSSSVAPSPRPSRLTASAPPSDGPLPMHTPRSHSRSSLPGTSSPLGG